MYTIIDTRDNSAIATANTQYDAWGCVNAYRRQGVPAAIRGQEAYDEAGESDSGDFAADAAADAAASA